MKWIFIHILILVYCFAEEIKHTVIKGDTLWDISGKYLKNNFRWKEIYEANKDKIKNPDLIYPEQEFRIFISTPITTPKHKTDITDSTPVATEVKPEPKLVVSTPVVTQIDEKTEGKIKPTEEPKEPNKLEKTEKPITTTPTTEITEEEEEITDEEIIDEKTTEEKTTKEEIIDEKIIKIKPTKTTFIASYEWEPDGVIIGSQEKKQFLSINDVVYINVGKDKNLQPNMKCYIYRATTMRKLDGIQMKFIGTLRVTEQIDENLSTGVIIYIKEPIRIKDPILILYE